MEDIPEQHNGLTLLIMAENSGMNNFRRPRSQRQQRLTTPHYLYNPYPYQQWQQVGSMGSSGLAPFTILRHPLSASLTCLTSGIISPSLQITFG